MRQPVPFGKYLLLDRISVGGMAEVFKAKSYGVEGFEKIIAIKRILPTMGEDRDFIKMFIDEAKIAGQLAHANICQIFELGRIDGSHFIAMEYIWGKDLLQIQNRLRKIKQPMPIAMACFSIAKVLEGLDYAHRKRDPLGRPLEIVHRDCSPQNVLVSYEGEVKVIDFGIAKATSRNSRTMAGVLKGKFGYMSPEQVRGLPLDRRSDIFALGTMLYECLTGDRLFQGETDFSTLEKVRNVDIRPPREINPNIPRAVEAVILKALAKDVDERYQWCSEMLADLQAFLMSQDVVFTAKSLSSWLKDVFQPEIERERQLLEQYKRVGRDGLIQGVPAAEAKADIVENLGEAGQAEGDPTTLGGPNFSEEPEGPAQEVGPAPGSPAARGDAEEEDDGEESFGEEAPTEIFGEIDPGASPASPLPAAGRPPTRPVPTGPAGGPPRPPARTPAHGNTPLPGMPPGPQQPFAQPPGFSAQSYANQPGQPYSPYASPPGQPGFANQPGYPPQGAPGAPMPSAGSQPVALGTPGAVPVAPPPGQGRTLIGQPAPQGLPNYAQGYPGQPGQMPPGQMPGQPYGQPFPNGGPPGAQGGPGFSPNPGYPGMPNPGYPGGPGMPPQGPGGPGGYPPSPSPYPMAPGMAPQNQPPFPGQPPFNAPVPPVDPSGAIEGKKRSPVARDVAIGVGIAALVLSGFLAVKYIFFAKDSTETAEPSTTPPQIIVSLSGATAAELYVDGAKVATVADKQAISVAPGQHKLKLVGATGAGCEHDLKLENGETKALQCTLPAAPANTGAGAGSSSGSAEAAGSAAGSGSAVAAADPNAGSAAGSGAGSAAGSADAGSAAAGSAAGSATTADTKPAVAPDRNDKMPTEDKPVATAKIEKPADKPADKPVTPPPATVTKPTTPPPATTTKPTTPPPATVTKPTTPPPATTTRPTTPATTKPKPPVDDDLGSLGGGGKPAEKPGYAAISSSPQARIAIDNKDTGLQTPISGHALPLTPGKHKVTFTVDGDKFTFTIAIKSGETTALHKDLR